MELIWWNSHLWTDEKPHGDNYIWNFISVLQSMSVSKGYALLIDYTKSFDCAVHAIHQLTPGWHVRSPTLWLLVTNLLFMLLIIVIKQSKDNRILCVCLILVHSSCLRETNATNAHSLCEGHICICVMCKPERLWLHPCFHMHFWLCVFLELRVSLLTGSVSGRGQWRFWVGHKIRVSERGREKEGLFHVTPHSTKAQAGRGTRQDMCPPSSHPPTPALLPSSLYPASTPPLCQWP